MAGSTNIVDGIVGEVPHLCSGQLKCVSNQLVLLGQVGCKNAFVISLAETQILKEQTWTLLAMNMSSQATSPTEKFNGFQTLYFPRMWFLLSICLPKNSWNLWEPACILHMTLGYNVYCMVHTQLVQGSNKTCWVSNFLNRQGQPNPPFTPEVATNIQACWNIPYLHLDCHLCYHHFSLPLHHLKKAGWSRRMEEQQQRNRVWRNRALA